MRKLPPKRFLLGAVLVLVVAAIVVAAVLTTGDESKAKTSSKTAITGCGSYRKDGVMVLNGRFINVEIAYTSQAKKTGLAGRPCIASNWGMLFDFGKDGEYPFWMRGMKFPIDIIWISSAHRVAAIQPDVEPSTYYSKNPYFINDQQHPARYVLEIKANQYQQLKLDIGMPVQFQKI